MIREEANMSPAASLEQRPETRERQSAAKGTCRLDRQRGRRKLIALFGAYTILAIVLIELVLVSPNLRPVEAGKKKKIMKKIKEILPLIALLKRKKIVLLPIPM